MKISVKWLKDYVDIKCSNEELVDTLTMLGAEVEGMEDVCSDFCGVVTAKIEKVSQHPNADKLKVCEVTDGANAYTVVCGAPNVREGMTTAFALAGAVLPMGKVSKANIRGVKSSGMLVSKKELGISDDHSGIFDIKDETPLGRELAEVLELRDTVIEVSITPNRPDLLSVIGIAREVAAYYNTEYKVPEVAFENVGGEVDKYASVEIQAPTLCPRYTGIFVKDVKIGPSPSWMARRLEAAGVRSINNIVDITNFVNLEIGQPLHAFDYDFLAKHKIVVRKSDVGEKITTLDDLERTLPTNSLLICDGEKPVALAGIMGGQNSLVTDETRDVFIESAYFKPTNIRRTSKALGLSTESSYRFERGIDIDNVAYGLHRAARLMEQYASGKVEQGYIDNFPKPAEKITVMLRPARANRLLGTDIPADAMARMLRSIDLEVNKCEEGLEVKPPAFRVDIEREVDLIEEVARLYGYQNIKPTLPKSPGYRPLPDKPKQIERAVRSFLTSQGLYETINYSFTTTEKLDMFKEKPGVYVMMKNPLNEEYAALRDTLLPGLCANVANNLKRQANSIKLFEVRKTFIPSNVFGEQPQEPLHAAGAFCGRREPEQWNMVDDPVDFFDMKGACEQLFQYLGVSDKIKWTNGAVSYLDKNECAQVLFDGDLLGFAGRLSKGIAKKFELKFPVYIFEFDLSKLTKDALPYASFEMPSKFPTTTKDIAVVVNKGQKADNLSDTIVGAAPELVKEVVCFDVYEGDRIGRGEKSLAFKVKLQKQDGEVSEKEAGKFLRKAIDLLETRFDAKLRQ